MRTCVLMRVVQAVFINRRPTDEFFSNISRPDVTECGDVRIQELTKN